MGKFIDLTNKKINMLTVLKRFSVSKDGNVKWLCQCDCGKTTIVQGKNLRNGNTKSCGCLFIEKHKKHGQYGKRIYRIWHCMKQRCYYQKHNSFPNYGGRGIIVCNDWLGENGFVNFYNWSMKNGYKENLTIERINPNGNYEPSNCKWVTMKEQQNNKRNNRLITYENQTLTMSEWADKYKIKHSTFENRLKRGYSMQEALSKKNDKKKYRRKGEKING